MKDFKSKSKQWMKAHRADVEVIAGQLVFAVLMLSIMALVPPEMNQPERSGRVPEKSEAVSGGSSGSMGEWISEAKLDPNACGQMKCRSPLSAEELDAFCKEILGR